MEVSIEATNIQGKNQILLTRPEYDIREFYFDRVLTPFSNQSMSYDEVAQPVVQDVLNGFNGVIMAYGQTGSGKTHTIFGSKPLPQDQQVQKKFMKNSIPEDYLAQM